MSTYYKKYYQNNNNGGVYSGMHNMALNSLNKRPALNPNMIIDELGTKVYCNNLHPTDPMYQTIADLITNDSIVIDNIVQVNNPFVQHMYETKKQQKTHEFGGILYEQYLFHGTKKANVDSICRYNFDWRYYGSNRGHKFGKGVSFSDDANYASYYSDDGYHKVMIVAKVLIANICDGYEEMELPPEGYDTSQKPDGRVLVKFEDNEYYPAYKIYYHFEEESDWWENEDDYCCGDNDWDEDDGWWQNEDDYFYDDGWWENEDDYFYEDGEWDENDGWWENEDDYFYYDNGYGNY